MDLEHIDAFEALSVWAQQHEVIYATQARLVHDDELAAGELVYGEHEVRMSRATRSQLEKWMDERAPLAWSHGSCGFEG